MTQNNQTNTTNDGAKLVVSNTPATAPGSRLVVSKTPVVAAATTMSVNIGVPGNLGKVLLQGNQKFVVRDALNAANLRSGGYVMRGGGVEVKEDSPIFDGMTIMLLRPVRGN